MKKTFYIFYATISCLFFCLSSSTAQDLSWAGSLANSTDNVTIESVIQDGNLDVYIVGSFQGTTDFDMDLGIFNLTSAGNTDIFVAKYDLNGTFIRAFQIGSAVAGDNSTAYDIAVDASNNIVIVGSFTSDATAVNFAPLGGTPTNLTSQTANVVSTFVAKYNSLGQCIWGMGMGNASTVNTFYAVAVDAADNIYVGGRMAAVAIPININPLGVALNLTTSNALSSDALLIKYNSSGIRQWHVLLGNGATANINEDLVVSGTNVYAVGRFQGTTNFNPNGGANNKTTAGSFDNYCAQYTTAAGTCNWVAQIGNTGNDFVNSVDVDAVGSVYFVGNFTNTLDLDAGGGVNNVTSLGSADYYVTKYDVAGNHVWGFRGGQATGADNANGISIDGTNLYITGRFKNTADFDPSASVANVTALGVSIDEVYLAKYTTDGAYLNAFAISGTGNDVGNALYADAGLVYLVGYFNDVNVDFDPGAGIATLSSTSTAPIYDGFFACYTEIPPVSLEKVAITEWLANPFGTESENEWIEIYNYGASSVNLKNWRLKDEDSDNSIISTVDLFLLAGERLILARNKAKFEERWLAGCVDSRVIDASFILTNTSDEIILENAAGDVVWSVAYQNDATEGRATYYTEATYGTNVFGSKATPGVVRAGNDVTGSLGYQKNNSTADALAVTNLIGDIGSPLNSRLVEYNRGNVLTFDGVDDYLNLGTTTNLEGLAAFTFETWIKPNSMDATLERIFSKRSANNNRIEICMGDAGAVTANNQFLVINICNGANETFTTPNGSVPQGVWSHVAVVFDGGQVGANKLKVYVNGIKQTVSGFPAAVSTPSGTGVAAIGRRADTGVKPADIELDELRIWSVARTETQLREKMHLTLSNCETGLLSYYQLNETTGTIAKDLKGNDAIYGDGVSVGLPTQVASPVNVGYGATSASQTIVGVGTGIQTFATANAVLEIQAHSALEDITVTYQAFNPNATLGIDGTTIIQNPMWTINTSESTESFKADFIFTFPVGLLTSTVANKYGLYWRTMNDGGTWTKLATASVVTATTVKFANMSLSGQFMVVQESNDLISDVRGNMYTFDGVDDYIITSPSPTYTNNSFTFETWVKTTTTIQSEIVAWGHTAGLDDVQIRVAGPSGLLDFGIYNGSWEQISSTTPINSGQWTHIAITQNNTNVTIFIDGVQRGTGTTSLNPTVNKFTIGGLYYNGAMCCNYFNGAIDEVRVWNTVRTQSQIRENMHLTLKGNETGLVSYYQFNNDDVVGTAAGVKDAMGTNHGMTQNMLAGSYLASEVAVAAGASDRMTVVAGGIYDFVNTGVHMEFGASAPNGELVVYRLETEKPHGASSITGDVDNEYFVVRNFGTLIFDPLLDITFGRMNYINPADVGLPQATSPFQLYKRVDNAYGASWGTSWGGADNTTGGSNGEVGFNTVNGVISFSQIVIVNTNSNSDLPVELLYFEAERTNADEVQLNWATATETNNQGFYVERMLDNETAFKEVAWVDGNGTTVTTNYYGQVDVNSHLGTSYYRLKQVDFDGTIAYSDIKAVAGRSSGKYLDLTIYPNPVSDKLTIEIKQLPKQVTSATIKILAIDGKVLHQFSQKCTSNQLINLDFVRELHPGVYMLAIETDDEELTMQKFIKK